MSPEIRPEAPKGPEQKSERVESSIKPVESAASRLEQAKAKCVPLKASLHELSRDYPELSVDAFQDEVENLVSTGELPADSIARVADALDNIALSEKGIDTFNELVEDGNTLYLCKTLMNNYYAIERLKLTELPDKEFDKVVNAVTDLTWIKLTISKGEVYTGFAMTESASVLTLWIGYKPKIATDQTVSSNLASSSEPSAEVNPFGKVSATQQEELEYASEYDDARIAENKAAIEEEYKMAFEETGISPEDFLAEKGLDHAGRPINEEE